MGQIRGLRLVEVLVILARGTGGTSGGRLERHSCLVGAPATAATATTAATPTAAPVLGQAVAICGSVDSVIRAFELDIGIITGAHAAR